MSRKDQDYDEPTWKPFKRNDSGCVIFLVGILLIGNLILVRMTSWLGG